MKKKSWICCLVAVAICLTAVSCSKEDSKDSGQDFIDNFKALVMGGHEIDSRQDWSTASGLDIKIAVDYGNTSVYKVYVLPSPALYDSEAAYLGMAQVRSGESKTITISRPANNALLYAACYDSDGHAVCKPFTAKASGTEIVFSGRIPSSGNASGTNSSGDRWSVPVMEFPDVSDYTTGPFVEASSLEGEPEGNDRLRLSISDDFNGYLPSLGIRGNMGVYVSGTWTLSFNQRVSNGNAIVVGSGGKIIVPKGLKLSAMPFGTGETGNIYILPGGEITGEGAVEYATGTGSYCYNAGIISANEIRIVGCSFYNSGVLGRETSTPTSVVCLANGEGSEGVFINHGGAWLSEIKGENLSLQNASYLNVSNQMTLGASSRLADGSYTYTPSLVLDGNSEGGRVVYMGNGAILQADAISIDNFGVWGPVGEHFTANAVLKVDNCEACTTTDGVADTYLLDHVELVLPTSFPIGYDPDHLNANNLLLYSWMNACEARLINDNNYRWAQVGNKDALVWNEAVSDCGCGDASRQTCTYGTSPTVSTTYMQKQASDVPVGNAVYYGFETIEGTLKDYDYNDVVLRVTVPVDRGDGTYVSNVQVMCVGNTIKTNVLYNGEPFGDEVHSVIGVQVTKTANVSSISRVFAKLGEIPFSDGKVRIDRLNFSLKTVDGDGNASTLQTGETPLFIVINGGKDRRWFWPTEGVNIGVAYPQFSSWASDMLTNLNWYAPANAVATKVVSWTLSDE